MELFGNYDQNIKVIEETLGVEIVARENQLRIKGNEKKVELAKKLINNLISMLRRGEQLNTQKINYAIGLVMAGKEEKIQDVANEAICLTHKGKQIKSKTLGQKAYI